MTELRTHGVESQSVQATEYATMLGGGEALLAVCEYAFDRFGISRFRRDKPAYDLLMNQLQWEQIREILQRILLMHDLEAAVQFHEERFMRSLTNSCTEDAPEIGGADPGLPHGWFTVLEAAYERLVDVDGLCRIYAYYIIMGVDAEELLKLNEYSPVPFFFNHYVEKLHDLAGERWPEFVQRIENLYDKYRSDPMFHSRNRQYEALLIQERHGAAAIQYCSRRCKDWYDEALVSDLFAVMAEYDLGKAADLLLHPLHDADSKLMRDNTPEGAQHVVNLLRRAGISTNGALVRQEAERLMRMYRHREHLKSLLKNLIKELPQEMN
ncbi:hypothetical protein BHAP_0078 [Bifidobacterium hapali]|uniref:Uncharacterized protein n=2 Tax=Bifidobacterium hapali TaxID=1630172 RepID=A0A261G5G4_9BIFI|nr:hypothetical protein BHAP_0078 [Bifidobacterium hapali]